MLNDVLTRFELIAVVFYMKNNVGEAKREAGKKTRRERKKEKKVSSGMKGHPSMSV